MLIQPSSPQLDKWELELWSVITSTLPAIIVPELAEAHAIRLALSFTKDEGMDNIVLASDRWSSELQTRRRTDLSVGRLFKIFKS